MSELRAFIALDLESTAIAALETALKPWKNITADKVAWIMPENLHLTLVFLGNIDESLLTRLSLSLTEVAQDFSPLTLSLTSLDYFPNVEHAKVLAATVAPTLELMTLEKRVIENIGIATTLQSFLPHITIGRFVENSQSIPQLTPISLSIQSTVNAICLYQSHLSTRKVKYEKIIEARFGGRSLTSAELNDAHKI